MKTLMAVVLLAIGCQESIRFETRVATIRYECVCASERSDAILLYAAIQREDMLTVIGFVGSGKAFRLARGSRVRTVASVEGFTRIAVETGLVVGERCWLPNRFVR